MDIDLIVEYKKNGKEEFRNKVVTSAESKIKAIATELCKRNKMLGIKEDMIQEGCIILMDKVEKVDIRRSKKEIKAYLESSIWKELKKKIIKEKRITDIEVKSDEIDDVVESDYFLKVEKEEILKIISELKTKDYKKEIFLDYFENSLTRKELEKKYHKKRSQIDYYLDNVKKSIQKQLKIRK